MDLFIFPECPFNLLGLKLLELCICYVGGPAMLVSWCIPTSREGPMTEQNLSIRSQLRGLDNVVWIDIVLDKVALLRKVRKQPKHPYRYTRLFDVWHMSTDFS